MDKQKKIRILLIGLFIIILLVLISLDFINKTKEEIIIHLIIFILEILPFLLFALLIYIAYQNGKRQAIKESMSENDFKNNKIYYRDILKNHSPAELSYIDNFQIDLKKEIISTLLSLKFKNKINIKNNFLEVIDNNINNLKETEIYILNSIKNGKVIIYNPYEMEGSAKKEAIDNGLIIKNEINDKNCKNKKTIFKYFKIIGISIFFLLIIMICIFNKPIVISLNNNVININNGIFIILLLIISIIIISRYLIIYLYISKNSYSLHKSKLYKRTELGEELNKKIEGLKNYIKNFSILNEKDKEELMLWDEYLIYSVIFGINNKILNELSHLIDIQK